MTAIFFAPNALMELILPLLLYSLLIYLLRPIALLWFCWRSRADRAYRQRFAERFAWQLVPKAARGGIVLHAVSMGEVVAAAPLIRQLLAHYPQLPLTVTCTTPTGSARIQALFGEAVYHCYLPFDTPGACRRFFSKLEPQLLLVLETELWPNLLQHAAKRAIPCLLLNARLSARSARGYAKISWFIRPLLQKISAILTIDDATRRRFACLTQGEGPQVVRVGNLKFEMSLPTDLATTAQALRTQWGERMVWVAGSTHAGEDAMILAAHQQLLQQWPELLLILVPRHPDRFVAVAQLIDERGLRCSQRSLRQSVEANTQVLLGDTMGELLLWYQVSQWVFIGGSLIERGGHNPLEAMCLNKPILSGPHVFNFKEIYQQLHASDAVIYVQDELELAAQLQSLIELPDISERMAQAGLALYQKHGGAVASTLQHLGQLPLVRQTRQGGDVYWQRLDVDLPADVDVFSGESWQQANAVVGQSKGRNTVYFVKTAGQSKAWVLRHYYRGGWVGKLNRDWFWQVPLRKSRAMAEFHLLQWMAQQGLAVPKPVACRYQAAGLGYRADILLEQIEGSTDLFHYLCKAPLSATQWQHVGALVRQLFALGVYHSDLNCHNILLDDKGQFWLIDFDKCARRQGTAWQEDVLARLLRSLQKEQRLHAGFHFTADDWQQVLVGFGESTQ